MTETTGDEAPPTAALRETVRQYRENQAVTDIADELRRVIPIADSYGRPLHERALAEIERLRARDAALVAALEGLTGSAVIGVQRLKDYLDAEIKRTADVWGSPNG